MASRFEIVFYPKRKLVISKIGLYVMMISSQNEIFDAFLTTLVVIYLILDLSRQYWRHQCIKFYPTISSKKFSHIIAVDSAASRAIFCAAVKKPGFSCGFSPSLPPM